MRQMAHFGPFLAPPRTGEGVLEGGLFTRVLWGRQDGVSREGLRGLDRGYADFPEFHF